MGYDFLVGSPLADACRLREILRSPEVYTLHPQPEVAAAMRVCERYTPQIGQQILNYTESALDVNEEKILDGNCACRSVLRQSMEEQEKQKCIIDGQVCTKEQKMV